MALLGELQIAVSMLQECADSLKRVQVGGPQIEVNGPMELMESIVEVHISPFESLFATRVSLQKMTIQAFGICFFGTETLDAGLIYSLCCCLDVFLVDLKQRKCGSIDAVCVCFAMFW